MADIRLRIQLDDGQVLTAVGELQGENKELQRELDRTGQSGSSSMQGIAVAAGITVAAIGAVTAGAAAAWHELERIAQVQDDIAKQSRRLGVGVESLSAYRLAAKLTGTSLETIGVALRSLARNALDASKGVGEGAEAFQLLDVDVEDSNGNLKDSESLLLEVADRFRLIDDSTAKLALAQRIFGRGGTELLTLLEQGSSGIEAMKNRAQELGITFDAETAAGAEKFDDALAELGFAFEGIKDQVANELIPLIVKFVPEITALFVQVGSSIKTLIRSDIGEETIGFLRSRVQDAVILIRFLASVASNPLAFLSPTTFGTTLNLAAEISRITAEVRGSFAELADQETENRDKNAELGTSLDNLAEKLRNLQLKTKDAKDQLKELGAADLRKLGLPVPTSRFGTTEPPGVRPTLGVLSEAQKRAGQAALPTDEQIRQNEIALGIRKPEGIPDISESLPKPDLGFQTPELAKTFGEFPEPPPHLHELTDDIKLLGDTLNEAGQAWEEFILKQGKSSQKFGTVVALMLAGQSKLFFTQSLSELATGVAALTPWGSALYGPAPPHFKSAALFGAAAGATGGVARAIGVEGGGGRGGGFGGGPGQRNPIFDEGITVSELRRRAVGPSPTAPDLGAIGTVDSNQQVAQAVRAELDRVFSGLKAVPAGQAAVLMVESAGGLAPLMTSTDKQNLAAEVLNESRL